MAGRNDNSSKLKDIRETASDAVELMRELGTPGVQETFDTIREIATIAKEIMETMKTPEWQQNMENIRIISENFNQASQRMDRTTKELKETGVIDDAKELIQVAKTKMQSFDGEKGGQQGGISSQDLKEVAVTFKDMLESIKVLFDELKLVAADSKRSGTLRDIEETIKDASETYGTVKRELER